MAFGFRHWNPRDLLAAWSIYWIGLSAVAARSLWRLYVMATSVPKGRSSVRLTMDDGRFDLAGLVDGQRVLGGSMSMLALALLIAGPPLALWALWLLRRPRRGALEAVAAPAAPLLPEQRWTSTPHHDASRREELHDPRER